MGTVVLIGTVAIIVAIVGCFFIWRLDASRAEEVEHTSPPPGPRTAPGVAAPVATSRSTSAPRPPRGQSTRSGGPFRPPAWQVRRVTTPVATDCTGGTTMGLDDKIDNKGDELKGKAKEATGKATDDEKLEAEGRGDQAGANVKQAGEKIKDAFKS